MKFFLCFLALAFSLQAKELVIEDILDRQVRINLPAKRMVLGFYYTDFLAVGKKEAFDRVVGFVKDAWAVYMSENYEAYKSIIPRLEKLADVGDPQFGTFSIEKLLALKPDLFIIADWQYELIKEHLPLLEKQNIPVIVLSYNKESYDQHAKSTEILGLILDQEQRAKQINAFYKTRLDEVQSRIAKAGLKKPKIYIEFGNKGASELSFTFGNDMWGALINLAGGDNIARNLVQKWAVINNEQIIASNPDVIIITGRERELHTNKEAMVMGVHIEESEALRRLLHFKERIGWADLKAVKNERLFAAYHRASTTMADIASVEFIAKMLYPQLFKDIDPNKTYEDFHTLFMPFMPEGTYYIGGIAK
ncbi:iron ABC transporter substrate-binding protein [Campylobacter sp. MIT 12-5580]|uniref:ABC transporter substrate-binding protein n=1 Tax=Campylobacter sp. MIT 12-5580 TaxID=2040651 RepID=UPI0010F6F46F|nr:ABC transporter substrate-binding protein [Campylobacter sp. MIT 12-5580]TKX29225.1 iron ABC transporter substrate-binding protein [Campylobacter sp. MIT 12-5580]